uniref:C2H2-type domain-containing protein n=1 Tax=Macrostomum lignano TaxID=282301 RepID=A0A1I8G4I1_9PLAT
MDRGMHQYQQQQQPNLQHNPYHGLSNGRQYQQQQPPPPPPVIGGGAGEHLFFFKKRAERLDWRRLAAIDVDRISATWTLPPCRSIWPGLLIAMLSQNLLAEYLAHTRGQLERQTAEAQAEALALKQRLADKQREANDLKRECHKRKKLLIAQQQLMEAGPQSYQRCPYCPKAFLNNTFLRSHINRRHGGAEYPPTGAGASSGRDLQTRVDLLSQLTREELLTRLSQLDSAAAASAGAAESPGRPPAAAAASGSSMPARQPEDDLAAVSAQMRRNLDLHASSRESLLMNSTTENSMAQGVEAMRTSGLLARLKGDRGIVEGLKSELAQLLEEQLEERGIGPNTTRISNRVLNEKLAMLAREREQVAFKFKNFEQLRRQHAASVDAKARQILNGTAGAAGANASGPGTQSLTRLQQQQIQRPTVRVTHPEDDEASEEEDSEEDDEEETEDEEEEEIVPNSKQQVPAQVHTNPAPGNAAAATAIEEFDSDEYEDEDEDEYEEETATRTADHRHPETAVSATDGSRRPPGVPDLRLGGIVGGAGGGAGVNPTPSPRLPRSHQQQQLQHHLAPDSPDAVHAFDSPDGAVGGGGISRHPQQRLPAEASSSWDSQGDEISELNAVTNGGGGAADLNDEVNDLLQKLGSSGNGGGGGLNVRGSAQTDNSNTLDTSQWAVTSNVVSTVNPGATGRSLGTNKSSDIGEESFDD